LAGDLGSLNETEAMQPVSVFRGKFADPVPPFGPLPGVRIGDVLAYEFELPERFVPKPGHARLERTFALLDLGVSMSCPAWSRTTVDGLAIEGIDPQLDEAVTWYVDLVHITADGDRLIIRDLYLDVMVPTDGRHQRMLDLDEFADAIEAGTLPVDVAVDALRRWQAFLDRHLHSHRDPRSRWSDFPPEAIREFDALPSPLGPIVTAL
jgi:hypothetical protein